MWQPVFPSTVLLCGLLVTRALRDVSPGAVQVVWNQVWASPRQADQASCLEEVLGRSSGWEHAPVFAEAMHDFCSALALAELALDLSASLASFERVEGQQLAAEEDQVPWADCRCRCAAERTHYVRAYGFVEGIGLEEMIALVMQDQTVAGDLQADHGIDVRFGVDLD